MISACRRICLSRLADHADICSMSCWSGLGGGLSIAATAALAQTDDKEFLAKFESSFETIGNVPAADFVSAIPDPSMAPAALALSKKGWDAVRWQLQSQGYDTEFGRRLYHDVVMNGLGDLQAEGFVPMQIGGMPFARFWKTTLA